MGRKGEGRKVVVVMVVRVAGVCLWCLCNVCPLKGQGQTQHQRDGCSRRKPGSTSN